MMQAETEDVKRCGTGLPWLLAAVAIGKLAILGIVGPSPAPDTVGYTEFADAVIDGRAFAPLAWGSEALPVLALRTAGYPLIIAAAKLAAPSAWAWLVVIAQSALSLVALGLMFRVAERLFASRLWAAVGTLLYACSASLLWDNSLLSDGLYASLFNIVVFALLGALLGCWQLSRIRLAGLAVLWGYSVLTRENGLYFSILPLLLLWLIGASGDRRRRLGAPLAFAAILAAMVGGYALLNLYRTGEAFLGIGGETAFLQPLLTMRARGYADPFDDNGLLARTVNETMTAYDFPAERRLLDELHERCGCTPTEIQSMAFRQYLAGVARHPVAYLRVVAVDFDYFDRASDIFDPVSTINQFFQLGTPLAQRVIPGLSIRHLVALRRQFSVPMLALMLVAGVTKLASAVLFTGFVVGVPWLWLRARRRDAAILAIGFLWLAFMTVALAFSLVHFEARYALPVFPAAQLGMLYVVRDLARRCLSRSARAGNDQTASAP